MQEVIPATQANEKGSGWKARLHKIGGVWQNVFSIPQAWSRGVMQEVGGTTERKFAAEKDNVMSLANNKRVRVFCFCTVT